MGSISQATAIRLFANAGNHCAFPECDEELVRRDGSIVGEMCHIRARKPRGPRYDPAQSASERNAYENLIVFCRNHHKIVDAQHAAYTVEVLQEMKALAEKKFGRPEQPTDKIFAKIVLEASSAMSLTAENSNVAINSPNAIQANVINFRSTRKVTAMTPPPGTIGADGDAARYVEYLIGRYNDYAKNEPTRSRAFSHAAIRKNIEHNFGIRWQLLTRTRFSELCDYLQGRIARTRIAKLNKARGVKAFSTFEEYNAKHCG